MTRPDSRPLACQGRLTADRGQFPHYAALLSGGVTYVTSCHVSTIGGVFEGMTDQNATTKVVVLGAMSKMPVGGIVFITLQYVLGLKRLGFDVYYVEARVMAAVQKPIAARCLEDKVPRLRPPSRPSLRLI